MSKQPGLQLIQSIQQSAAFVQIHTLVPFAADRKILAPDNDDVQIYLFDTLDV